MLRVEGVEPVADVAEEREALQLGERAHVDIDALHLHVAQLLHLAGQSCILLLPLLPFRVLVIEERLFVQLDEVDFRAVDVAAVLEDLGDDFIAHLAVCLLGLADAQQLNLHLQQPSGEVRLLLQQLQACQQFRFRRQSFLIGETCQDDACQRTLCHLGVGVFAGIKEAVQLAGIEHLQQSHRHRTHEECQVVGRHQYRCEEGARLLQHAGTPCRRGPDFVEQAVLCRFVAGAQLVQLCRQLFTLMEQARHRHVLGERLEDKAIVCQAACVLFLLAEGGIEQFRRNQLHLHHEQAFVQGIGLSEQVGMKTLTLRVAHVAAEVLEHVAVGSL